ncbi:MAG TPA: response regulator transcription factor [Xanthobacteraceae bacterium]|nr:response regulator transcription factor [Xanthobacteraceae bacterium]
MRALLMQDNGAAGLIEAGELTINVEKRTVEVAGTPVHLTGREYQVLELLASRKQTVLSKAAILKHLYGEGATPDPKIVDVFICNLRRKLGRASEGRDFIETVRGRGYALRATVRRDEKIPA